MSDPAQLTSLRQRVVSVLSKSSFSSAPSSSSSASSSATSRSATSLVASSARHLNYWLSLPIPERKRIGAFRKDWLSLTKDGIVVSKEVTSVSGKGIVSETDQEDEQRKDDILPSSESELAALIQAWPEGKVQGFLSAYEGLLALSQLFEKEEIHCNFGCQELIAAREEAAKLNESNAANPASDNQKTESTLSSSSSSLSSSPSSSSIAASLRDCFTPLPFLLPWPAASFPSDRELDNRPSNALPRLVEPSPSELLDAWVSGRTPAEWAPYLAGTGYESQGQVPPFHPPLAVADGSQPIPEDAPEFFEQFAGLVGKDNTTLGNLSSIVNGNIWPASMPNADLHLSCRVQGELRIAAAFIGRLVGVPLSAQTLEGSVSAYYYIPGERSGEKDARSEERMGWDRFFAKGFTSVPGSADRKPLPPQVVEALKKLFPSSFLVQASAAYMTLPCPALLVAPVAPGWIGGFISPRSDGESFGYAD